MTRVYPKVRYLVPLFLLIAILLLLAACIFVGWPRPVHVEASGRLQDGNSYRVSVVFAPTSTLPLGKHDYQIAALELTMADITRAVPSMALANITGFDPAKPLQVFEEGSVIVVTTQASHPIQWRFLNGQFAQRRILAGTQPDVRNFQAQVDRPSIIGPPPQGSPRLLQSSSILPPAEDSAYTNSPRNP